MSHCVHLLAVTTHHLEEADVLCDRLMIMDHGQIVAEGTPRALKQQVPGDAILITLKPGDQASGARCPCSGKSHTCTS